MIALAPWQALLDGLGWVVAEIYELIPNYGLTIILLTIVIRLVLLPLGIKQVRSMQHMQIVQPRIKQVQQKFKGNKQRQQEEIMKLYKEYGVNPFSGCWPVLLQFPILIAMYSVLRWPQEPIHVPTESALYAAVSQQIPETIDGFVPAVGRFPSGCRFRNRCAHETASCAEIPAQVTNGDGHRFRCWNPAQEG